MFLWPMTTASEAQNGTTTVNCTNDTPATLAI